MGSVTRLLLWLEWVTIGFGVIATIAVLVGRPRQPSPDAGELHATSACQGGKGTKAEYRAWLDGAELPGEPTSTAPPADAALRDRGQTLFTTHCSTCHGTRGDGKGETAAMLLTPPADLTSGVYALRTTEHEGLPTDADLFRTITRGIHGTAMPPWFALPERDRWALVAYVKSLSKAFSEDEAPPPIEAKPPMETPARIEHGSQLFASGGCASCHGDEGRGDGLAAPSLPIKPRNFTAGRFHRGSTTTDIYTSIATGLDGTPMGSFSKVLGPDDLWDIAMFVHRLAPEVTQQPGGLRCATNASSPNADEKVAVRTALHSL
jgi:mono/diheme cytochrome c family protein